MVRLRLALILLDLYFSALEIENTEAGIDNFEDRDLIISGTVNDTSTDMVEDLSKNVKNRKYHWLYSNSVILEWMKGWWRVNASRGMSNPIFLYLVFTLCFSG